MPKAKQTRESAHEKQHFSFRKKGGAAASPANGGAAVSPASKDSLATPPRLRAGENKLKKHHGHALPFSIVTASAAAAPAAVAIHSVENLPENVASAYLVHATPVPQLINPRDGDHGLYCHGPAHQRWRSIEPPSSAPAVMQTGDAKETAPSASPLGSGMPALPAYTPGDLPPLLSYSPH